MSSSALCLSFLLLASTGLRAMDRPASGASASAAPAVRKPLGELTLAAVAARSAPSVPISLDDLEAALEVYLKGSPHLELAPIAVLRNLTPHTLALTLAKCQENGADPVLVVSGWGLAWLRPEDEQSILLRHGEPMLVAVKDPGLGGMPGFRVFETQAGSVERPYLVVSFQGASEDAPPAIWWMDRPRPKALQGGPGSDQSLTQGDLAKAAKPKPLGSARWPEERRAPQVESSKGAGH